MLLCCVIVYCSVFDWCLVCGFAGWLWDVWGMLVVLFLCVCGFGLCGLVCALLNCVGWFAYLVFVGSVDVCFLCLLW